MSQRVALAASGSETGRAVERFAFAYCRHHQVGKLLVIHVKDTALARYGEIEPLAGESCKADFIDYIKESARITSQQLHSRISAAAAYNNTTVQWLQVEGEVVTKVSGIVKEYAISTLIVGKGQRPESFFSPAKKTAANLAHKCSCRVLTAPLITSIPDQW